LRKTVGLLLFLFFSLAFCPPAGAAGNSKLNVFPAAGQSGQPVRLIWQLTGLGRPGADMLMGTNGLLYLPVGNTLTAVTTDGEPVWSVPPAVGNKLGRPVFGPAGSIFLPGDDAVQEIKTGGSTGWGFQVYRGTNGGATAALLCGGPGNDLLYLPLPDALYALNVRGRFKWALLSWDSVDANSVVTPQGREILDAAGDGGGVYVIYGVKGGNYYLAAVGADGSLRWRYSLGFVKSAHVFVGGDGLIYVTASPARLGRVQKGTVYAFAPRGTGSPAWSFRVPYDDLSAPAFSASGVLYFCAGDRLYALDAQSGAEEWDLPLLNITSPPAVDDAAGLVYVGGKDGYIFAVGRAGGLAWERDLDGAVTRTPLVGADGYLYVVTDRGSLYKLAPVR